MDDVPLHVFRFQVDFEEDGIAPDSTSAPVALCAGAFAECSGLEATMEPKTIREGGRNDGLHQRVGPVSYGTVILKRGLTTTRDLWYWFELVASGGYAQRLTATVTVLDQSGEPMLAWRLKRAMPTKFKTADLNARGAEVGIEELHLVHEGLSFVRP